MIGLYGATANNLYVFAKALHAAGLPIHMILDRKDNFPHSQPVWEDVDLFFESGFDYRSIDWDQFEKDHDWDQPDYYVVPRRDKQGWKKISCEASQPLHVRLLGGRYLKSMTESVGVFEEMRKCKFLIVCGTEAAIMAMLSGVPYMIFPHGSDMRLAIGNTPKKSWKGKIIEWLCTRAFLKAECIGCHLPDASAEVPLSEYRRLQDLVVERVPPPYRVKQRLPQQQRRSKLRQLFVDLKHPLPEADHYCFVPSRIDFHWKGHDRLLEAIREAGNASRVHFIFLGWGDDYLEAMDFVRKHQLQQQVTILPIFCSKGFLYRFFEAADFILDALNGSGNYGTSLCEAMSRGCPIVTWVSDMFNKPGWEAPPVIHARTQPELKDFILRLSSKEVDLDEQSKITSAWFKRVHAEEPVVELIKSKFGHFWQAGTERN